MNITNTLKFVAILFISVTAVLLFLLTFDVVSSDDMRDALTKLAATCGIIAAATLAFTVLGKDK